MVRHFALIQLSLHQIQLNLRFHFGNKYYPVIDRGGDAVKDIASNRRTDQNTYQE
jgi:hypothetical protein